ncbi:MAG: cellobiose phosphorylase [Firmicutes bacterium]|nr:cellobiose phosphorylase [Bacillota bacterium]
MRVHTRIESIPIGSGKLKINLLKSSLIHNITYEKKMINQLRMTDADDMLSNIYLRIKRKEAFLWKKVIGESSCIYSENRITYFGMFEELHYVVQIDVIEDMWFTDVTIKGNSKNDLVDVFLFQDIGIKDGGAIRNNEAYNSQYIDHKVFEVDQSHVICSLQNQGNKEYLQIGALTPTQGYATDGYQFFGLDFKGNHIPKAMKEDRLPNQIYQYEFAAAVLQSVSSIVNENEEHRTIFYGYFVNHHPSAIQMLEYREHVFETYNQIDQKPIEMISLNLNKSIRFNHVYTSPSLNQEEIENLYPIRHFEENENGKLLSFFNDHHEHIVLQEKESYVERAHGHIILGGKNHFIREEVMASTSFIYGVFNSQIVLGNTSFSKLVSNTRNGLNFQRTHGQRIFIKMNDTYQLLGLPAVYEMGFNYSKWLYKVSDDIIEVKSYTLMDSSEMNLEVISHQGYTYDLLITSHIVMGSDEYSNDFHVSIDEHGINIYPVSEAFICTQYPNIKYRFNLVNGDFDVPKSDEELSQLFDGSLLKIPVKGSYITINIQGSLYSDFGAPNLSNFQDERLKYITYYKDLMNQFHVSIDKKHPMINEVMKLNTTMFWYMHNALIHFASPHGLEQFGGAAWGTRDVCQGPFEFFMSLNRYDEAKAILETVFMHQFEQNGDWPQWFMFDKFFRIQAKEAHGDIIVWPLRSMALYLTATHDFDILKKEVPYTDLDTALYTDKKHTILDHMLKAIQHIKDHYIPNTHLSSYGDGDWDDTLQPANSSLRKSMVSGWTTALTYETFMLLSKILKSNYKTLSSDLLEQAGLIKNDYMKYVMKDNVPAGFLFFGEDNVIKHIIHPTDQETHMKYRLLPMNRGIISQLFDKNQAHELYQVIKDNLYHPDGVRLMNTTVKYKGGENTYFKRAETSASFGREIGLQYVHAHIRFIEAVAKLGFKEEAWTGLQKINPICIKDVVPNAMHRQANAYFSSSDANFLNRYEAMKDFDKLFTGSIGVKGGWRVYSSGPGIYINQIISNVLGFRKEGNELIIDPQIPNGFNGLELNYVFNQKRITLKYNLKGLERKVLLNNKPILFTVEDDLYRAGAIHIPLEQLIGDQEYILEYFA